MTIGVLVSSKIPASIARQGRQRDGWGSMLTRKSMEEDGWVGAEAFHRIKEWRMHTCYCDLLRHYREIGSTESENDVFLLQTWEENHSNERS
jgi:hypothetical protein